jgi:hypothetical protein
MDNPTNTRIFEQADGLLAVSALYRETETTKAVKKSVMEFIYFYLLPEDTYDEWDGNTGTAKRIKGSGSGKSNDSARSAGEAEDAGQVFWRHFWLAATV